MSVDYEHRAKHLLSRLDLLCAQAKWEREHQQSVVRWDIALENLLLRPDGLGIETEEGRENKLSRCIDLLRMAAQVLSMERRRERLRLQTTIRTFIAGAFE